MPRKFAEKKQAKDVKKEASKPIKKDAKSKGRKNVIDEAVLDKKNVVHYILILDDSSSMWGQPWTELRAATDEYLKALVNSREANSSRVSCIIYNTTSRIVFQDEAPSASLINKI